jgi:hypothetical protein
MSERLDATAIVTTLLAPLASGGILLFGFIFRWPGEWGAVFFFSIAALPVGFLAIYRARTGGIITIIMGGLLMAGSLSANHYPQYYVPVVGLSLAGGLLHLFRDRW